MRNEMTGDRTEKTTRDPISLAAKWNLDGSEVKWDYSVPMHACVCLCVDDLYVERERMTDIY